MKPIVAFIALQPAEARLLNLQSPLFDVCGEYVFVAITTAAPERSLSEREAGVSGEGLRVSECDPDDDAKVCFVGPAERSGAQPMPVNNR